MRERSLSLKGDFAEIRSAPGQGTTVEVGFHERRTLGDFVADDHAPIRVGVSDVLSSAGCRVVAEVGSADAAVEAAVRTRPDVCLIDVDMPGNGIQAVGRILERVPDTHVLMLTVSDTYEDLVDALREGAIGYLLKDIAPALLSVEDVRAAADGTCRAVRSRGSCWCKDALDLTGRQGMTNADGRRRPDSP